MRVGEVFCIAFQARQDRLAGSGVLKQLGGDDFEEGLECIEVQKQYIGLAIVMDQLGAGCRGNQLDIGYLPALQGVA